MAAIVRDLEEAGRRLLASSCQSPGRDYEPPRALDAIPTLLPIQAAAGAETRITSRIQRADEDLRRKQQSRHIERPQPSAQGKPERIPAGGIRHRVETGGRQHLPLDSVGVSE